MERAGAILVFSKRYPLYTTDYSTSGGLFRFMWNFHGTMVMMDLRDSLMYQPDIYLSFFQDVEGDPMCDDGWAKMTAMRQAVEDFKGESEHNKVKYLQKTEMPITVEENLVQQQVKGPGGNYKNKDSRVFQTVVIRLNKHCWQD